MKINQCERIGESDQLIVRDLSQTHEVGTDSPQGVVKRADSSKRNDNTMITSALLNETLTSRSDAE